MVSARRRLRDLGMAVGVLPTGRWNAITDVPGVRVGHVTLDVGRGFAESVCTGVTAVAYGLPDSPPRTLRAASHVINGFGKTAGLVQLDELGELEGPILLTNTFAVGAVLEGGLRHRLLLDPRIGDDRPSANVVVG